MQKETNGKILDIRRRYFLRPSKSKISFLSRIDQRLKEDGRKASRPNSRSDRMLSIKRLPTEILLKILSNLSIKDLSLSVAPVCRKWFLCSRSPSLWRNLKFEGDLTSTQEVLRLLRQSPELKQLEIINRTDTKVLLSEVSRSNRQLERIIIKHQYNPKATRLSPYAINFSTDHSHFGWQCIESIFDGTSIPYAPIHTKNNSHVPAFILLRILRSCRRLRAINLLGIEMRSRRFFEELVQLPKLQSVDVTIGDRGGIMAWEMATLLRDYLGEGSRATPLHLNAIYNWCNNDIRKCSSSHWRMQIPNMSHILRLLVPSVVVLSLDAISIEEEMFEELLKCISLQALHLNNALSINSTIVVRMLISLQYLTSLQINQAYRLSPVILYTELHCRMRSIASDKKKLPLKYLSMIECPGIDDASVHAVASYCPQLQHLSLAQCKKITDEGLRSILCFCRNLRYLNLWNCTGFVGCSLIQIPKYAPQLKVLMIGDCNTSFIDKRKEANVALLKKTMAHIIVHYAMVPPRGWTALCRDPNTNS